MKEPYVAIIAICVIAGAYALGLSNGRESANDSWRRAVSAIPSEACRHAVMDALQVEPE